MTGRASEALSDVLSSLSERVGRLSLSPCTLIVTPDNLQGLSKWDTTMTDAFVKIRDFAEKRIALASQRLYIIMKEVKGWAKS